MTKKDYVRAATQTRVHICHWPGCEVQVPPAKWGCFKHWFRLPPLLRKKVWAAFRPGQEIDMRPSNAYIDVVTEVDEWIRENYPL